MRKLYFLIFMAFLFVSSTVQTANLGELEERLRHRINQVDKAISVFDTTTSFAWLNMAQDKIAVLAGYLPNDTNILYLGGIAEFELPSSLRTLRSVIIKSQGRFYSIFHNPDFVIDTPIIQYTWGWEDEDTPFLIIKLGGFQDVQYIFEYSSGVSRYVLPEDFRNITGALYSRSTSAGFRRIFPNLHFLIDTNIVSYSIHWKNRDTALFYLSQNAELKTLDSVSVFYQRTLQSGDTVRILYSGIPTVMTNSTIECQLPNDLEEFVIEEAIGYYFTYKMNEAIAQAWWQKVRIDMGVLRPGGER